MAFIDEIKAKAKADKKTVILPETPTPSKARPESEHLKLLQRSLQRISQILSSSEQMRKLRRTAKVLIFPRQLSSTHTHTRRQRHTSMLSLNSVRLRV